MTKLVDGPDCAPAALAAPRGLRAAFQSIRKRVAEWRERAEQRRHLSGMNDRMLKDVGISRADAVREASKPFWQA